MLAAEAIGFSRCKTSKIHPMGNYCIELEEERDSFLFPAPEQPPLRSKWTASFGSNFIPACVTAEAASNYICLTDL